MTVMLVRIPFSCQRFTFHFPSSLLLQEQPFAERGMIRTIKMDICLLVTRNEGTRASLKPRINRNESLTERQAGLGE